MNKPAIFITITTMVLIVGIILLAKTAGTATRQQATSKAQTELVKTDSSRLGSPEAKVTIVEFGDYQCPACASVEPILKKLLQEYDGKISLVFRHFPLPMHQNSRLAAQTAEAAGLQGKFWEMHDLLYAKQQEWSDSGTAQSLFTGYAHDLGLDDSRFANDLSNNNLKQKIYSDEKDAQTLRLEGTPTLFINGQQFRGSLEYISLKNAVKTALN